MRVSPKLYHKSEHSYEQGKSFCEKGFRVLAVMVSGNLLTCHGRNGDEEGRTDVPYIPARRSTDPDLSDTINEDESDTSATTTQIAQRTKLLMKMFANGRKFRTWTETKKIEITEMFENLMEQEVDQTEEHKLRTEENAKRLLEVTEAYHSWVVYEEPDDRVNSVEKIAACMKSLPRDWFDDIVKILTTCDEKEWKHRWAGFLASKMTDLVPQPGVIHAIWEAEEDAGEAVPLDGLSKELEKHSWEEVRRRVTNLEKVGKWFVEVVERLGYYKGDELCKGAKAVMEDRKNRKLVREVKLFWRYALGDMDGKKEVIDAVVAFSFAKPEDVRNAVSELSEVQIPRETRVS